VAVETKEIIILHAFRKKTQKTPEQTIALALQRLKEVENGKR
jgi:phage-related protein